MTLAPVSAVDAIRDRLCEVCDMLNLAIRYAACPEPEWTAVRHARQMADDLIGAVEALIPAEDTPPVSTTYEATAAYAALRRALWHPAIADGMARLSMDFGRGQLTLHLADAGSTTMGCTCPATDADGLPEGPLERGAA